MGELSAEKGDQRGVGQAEQVTPTPSNPHLIISQIMASLLRL